MRAREVIFGAFSLGIVAGGASCALEFGSAHSDQVIVCHYNTQDGTDNCETIKSDNPNHYTTDPNVLVWGISATAMIVGSLGLLATFESHDNYKKGNSSNSEDADQ